MLEEIFDPIFFDLLYTYTTTTSLTNIDALEWLPH